MSDPSSGVPLVLRKDNHLVLAVYEERRATLTEVIAPIVTRPDDSLPDTHKISAGSAPSVPGQYSGDYRECDIRFNPADRTCFAHATTTHLRYSRVQAVGAASTTNCHNNNSNNTAADGRSDFQLVTLFETAMPHVVIDLAFSPRGSYLVTYALMDAKRTPAGNLSIYAVATGQLLRRSIQARWPALAWTADECYVVRPVSGVMQVLPGSFALPSTSSSCMSDLHPRKNNSTANNTDSNNDDGYHAGDDTCAVATGKGSSTSKQAVSSSNLTSEPNRTTTLQKAPQDDYDDDDASSAAACPSSSHTSSTLSTVDLALPHDKEIAFAVSPSAALPILALFKPHHKQRQSSLSVYRLPDTRGAVILEAFFGRAEGASLHFSPSGAALALLVNTERDSSEKSYYGTVRLHLADILQRTVKEVKLAPGGANDTVHDCAWSPTQDELLVVHGKMPCNRVTLYDKKGAALMSFGEAPRNVALWSPNAMFVVLGGSGNLAGDYQFYERCDIAGEPAGLAAKTSSAHRTSARLNGITGNNNTSKTAISAAEAAAPARCTGQFNEKSSTQQWCPDSHHFLCATVFSRLRVDNKVVVFKNNGSRMTTVHYPLLYGADWVSMCDPADYPRRPVSPVAAPASSANAHSTTATPSAVNNGSHDAGQGKKQATIGVEAAAAVGEVAAKSQVYRPPGGTSARLAALLRRPNAGAMNTTATMAKPAGPVGATVAVSKKRKK